MSAPHDTVVVRHSLLLRIGWVPLFGLGLSSWAGLVTTALDGFPGLGWDAVVVVPLGVGFALALTLGGVGTWRFRQLVSATELVSRGLFRTRTITADSAESIAVVAGANRGLRRATQFGGFVVSDHATPPTRVVVSRTDTNFPAAFERLAAWAQRRPELVAHDSWARELLAGRGAPDDQHAES